MKGIELAAVEKIVGDKSPPRHSSMQSTPPRASTCAIPHGEDLTMRPWIEAVQEDRGSK